RARPQSRDSATPGGFSKSISRSRCTASAICRVTHLGAACRTLASKCVAGITANVDVLRAYVENSIGLVTALNPSIGYAAATEIAKEALATGRGVAELVVEKGLIPAEELAKLLRPETLARAN
ncbi:hypothetical protein ACWDN5_46260, partial [Amycolatopsis sp. NPDC003731]